MANDQSRPARPPQKDDHIPTRGEDQPFQGTNPWSGPYLVLAILVLAGVVVLGMILAVIVWH